VPPTPGKARRAGRRITLDLMTLVDILLLALAVAAGWLIWDGLRLRETANLAMRDACRRHGLLFLDDTVALSSLRPFRGADGRLRLRRVFTFEYSDTGRNRRKASLTMIGDEIAAIDIGPTLDADPPAE
jgi:hypothetical protein